MRPQWFDLDSIPYDDMWADDLHWLPWYVQHTRYSFFQELCLVVCLLVGVRPAQDVLGLLPL